MAYPKKSHKVCPHCLRDLTRSEYRERPYRGKERGRRPAGALHLSWICRDCERVEKRKYKKPKPRASRASVCEVCRRTFYGPRFQLRCSYGCRKYTDLVSRPLVCADCGKPLGAGRSTRRLCPPCAEERQRELSRLRMARLRQDPEWVAKHGPLERRRSEARKHKMRSAEYKMTEGEWQAILEAFGGQCAYCGAPATDRDHVVPFSKGGGLVIGNVVPACGPCNKRKNNHDMRLWLKNEDRYEAILMTMGDAEYAARQGEAI